jgi:general secretion pathway protein G
MKPPARGFTLIEMVAVVAIVAALAGMAVPVVSLVKQRTQELELRHALRTLRAALDEHKRAADAKEIELPFGSSGYPLTLRSLVDGVVDPRTPERKLRYFLRRMPRDPFAGPDTPAEAWGLRSYASPHDAPQAGADVYDVYSTSQRQAIDGTAYKDW